MIVAVKGSALVRDLDGEAVVLDLDSGTYYGLNAVAAWIWARLSAAGGLSLPALVDDVAREFGLEHDVAGRDVEAFVEQLRTGRLLHGGVDE